VSAARLRAVAVDEVAALRSGSGSPPAGLRWPADYPATETLDLVTRAWEAHRVLGWSGGVTPSWWLYQIVLGGDVVGDAGFGGPPGVEPRLRPAGAQAAVVGAGVGESAGLAEVEIGYHVLPAWRRRGIATSACRLLVEQAWRDGADVVRGETAPDNRASRRVLLGSGFVADGELGFLVRRPLPAGRSSEGAGQDE
jgi:RimJ/RimL family protein N-acetyltransferase